MSLNPQLFKIELRDKTYKPIMLLQNIAKSVSWSYNRLGGCGTAKILIETDIDNIVDKLQPEYEILIYLKSDASEPYVLFYRGVLEKYKYDNTKTVQKVSLECSGYSSKLKRFKIVDTYTNQEVSEIVKDILDTYIIPNTIITYDDVDIETTVFAVDQIDFDTRTDDALKTLAQTAGNFEWGVDRNLKFFFKEKSSTITHKATYKKDTSAYSPLVDYSGIINRLYITGGSGFSDIANNTESQGLYGLREDTISNSSIVTSSVAQAYGSAILAENALIKRRFTAQIHNNKELFESVIPLDKMVVISEPIAQAKKYDDDDAIYGQFFYGGLPSYQIDQINYTLTNEGTIVRFALGKPKPDLANDIKRLQFEIDQIRSA